MDTHEVAPVGFVVFASGCADIIFQTSNLGGVIVRSRRKSNGKGSLEVISVENEAELLLQNYQEKKAYFEALGQISQVVIEDFLSGNKKWVLSNQNLEYEFFMIRDNISKNDLKEILKKKLVPKILIYSNTLN